MAKTGMDLINEAKHRIREVQTIADRLTVLRGVVIEAADPRVRERLLVQLVEV